MSGWIFGVLALAVAGMFFVVRPGAATAGPGAPRESIAFLADPSAWIINFALGLLAVGTAALAFATDDPGFRVAMIAFALFGASMAAAECARRLAHLRRIRPAAAR